LGRFGSDPRAFFDSVYHDTAPWEVGGAQPAMRRLLAAHPPSGPILDLGSATGDLAVYLATLGHEVLGVEFVRSAVERARHKASQLPPDIAKRLRFEVADAARPSALGITFGAVTDSGFLHLLDTDETDSFIEDLGKALALGGRYYLHEFAVEFPIENVPRAVTEQELTSRFNERTGWRILGLLDTEFHSRVAQPTKAIAACIEKQPGTSTSSPGSYSTSA